MFEGRAMGHWALYKPKYRRLAISLMFVAALVFAITCVPRVHQPQAYHRFADKRTLIPGIPNTLNVLSNFPFLVIGCIGIVLCLHGNRFGFTSFGETCGWVLFFLGVFATAFGSTYYHLLPNDARLVWDRLPMTVSFTSILAVFVIERIDERTGTKCLIPLLAFGIGTIAYWRWTDDLRFYLVVQFFPLIAIPWMTLILPPKYSHNDYWLWAAAWYILAKIEEVLDKRIFKLLNFTLSGHTLKHLCAAMTPVCILLMLHRRCLLTERRSAWEQLKARFQRDNAEVTEPLIE